MAALSRGKRAMKLYTAPPEHCLKVYEILITNITTQYSNPKDFSSITASNIRKAILECLLQFCSDSLHRLGFVDHAQNGQLAFSPYIICKQSEFQESSHHLVQPPQCTSHHICFPPQSLTIQSPSVFSFRHWKIKFFDQSLWLACIHLAEAVGVKCLANKIATAVNQYWFIMVKTMINPKGP